MDNYIPETDSEKTAAESSANLSSNDAAKTASDYQPSSAEAAVSPTVSEIPSVKSISELPVLEVSNKATAETVGVIPEVSASVENTPILKEADPAVDSVQQPMQQPMGQPMQQPMGQPMKQPYQQPMGQPMQQPYQQPMGQPMQQPSTPGVTHQYYQYTPVNPVIINQQNATDGYAVASLVCALAGLGSCCTAIPSLLAIIFAAISKAKNDGTRPTGMSTAGLILGIIGLMLNLIILFAMFSN